MAFKILFATDLHFRLKKPETRTDENFFETQLAKVEYLASLSQNVDIVILGGDIFDRPDVGHDVVIGVMRAMRKFTKPVYSIVGQHEVFGYEGKTLAKSALGVLFEHGCLSRLDTVSLPIDVSGACIDIQGLHAFDADKWTMKESSNRKILVAHKMLTDKIIPKADCISIEAVAEVTNADIILSGDIHAPHAVSHGGKLFLNPGSLSRMKIDDRDRMPQAVILSIDGDNIGYNFVAVPAKPGVEVFDVAAYAERKIGEEHAKEFVKNYASAVLSVKAESNRIGDSLNKFIKDNEVADHLKQSINKYFASAEVQVLQKNKEK